MTTDAKKQAIQSSALGTLHIRSENDTPVLNAVDYCCKTHAHSQRLIQPSFFGRQIGDITDPGRRGVIDGKLAIQHIACDRQIVVAVSSTGPEAAFGFGLDALFVHQSSDPFMADCMRFLAQGCHQPWSTIGISTGHKDAAQINAKLSVWVGTKPTVREIVET